MGVKRYLGHFLLVVAIGFSGRQAAADEAVAVVSKIPASSVAKGYSITAVNVTSAGQTGDNDSFNARISGDGRYVVFVSDASNLIDNDENDKRDIFIYDRNTESGNGIERISVDKDDTSKGGNSHSGYSAISADGHYVVFVSDASNLVDNDENDKSDIFIYDRDDTTTANRIQRISVDKDYTSKGGNGDSYWSAISADGRYVVFESDASNLVAGDNNRQTDVFIYDRNTESGNGIERISVDKDDTSIGGNSNSSSPDISANGRYVVFSSSASNLVDGDKNGKGDIFIYDRDANSGNGIQRISVYKDDIEGDHYVSFAPAISGNGRYVVFSFRASNLVDYDNNGGQDVFIYDRDAESGNGIERISVDKDDTSKRGNDFSREPTISADGRYVVFESDASNLVAVDNNNVTDIFIYDRDATNANGIRRISVDKDDINEGGNSHSFHPAISADGRYVVFSSLASNLIDNDNKNKTVVIFIVSLANF